MKFNFEEIYQIYPRKEGKKTGMDKLKIKIKTQDQYDELLKGTICFARKMRMEKRERQYIKQFSAFVNQETWKEYLEEEKSYTTVVKYNHFNRVSPENPPDCDRCKNEGYFFKYSDNSLIPYVFSCHCSFSMTNSYPVWKDVFSNYYFDKDQDDEEIIDEYEKYYSENINIFKDIED